MSASAELTRISTSPDVKERSTLYRNLIESLLVGCPQLAASGSPGVQNSQQPPLKESIREVLTHAVAESTGLVTSRQILQDFVSLFAKAAANVKDGDVAAAEIVQECWEVALGVMQPRAVAFEEQVCAVVIILAV